MDKIEKALKKLTEKERASVKSILLRLKRGNLLGLDIKKLKGREDIFRARRGDIRIIYQLRSSGAIFILTIEHRSDTTYK